MRKGVTLVELLIVITILAILAMLLIGGMNFIAQVNKAADADKKADLNRIKIAFEDYFNDKGCYPDVALMTTLGQESNCGTNVFEPWLDPWLCTTRDEPYRFVVDNGSGCPDWFIVVTDLENENDSGLVDECGFEGCEVVGTDPAEMANYGVSSDNVLWYEPEVVVCNRGCFQLTGEICNSADSCSVNCFTGGASTNCHEECAIGSCSEDDYL